MPLWNDWYTVSYIFVHIQKILVAAFSVLQYRVWLLVSFRNQVAAVLSVLSCDAERIYPVSKLFADE